MKIKSLFILMILFIFILTGCNGDKSEINSVTDIVSSQETVKSDNTDLFSNRDFQTDYDESKSAFIQLQGNTASCSSDAVKISGSTVTITDEGTYVISGQLDNGMIIVNSDKQDKVQLVLDGATIHNEKSAAIYILQTDKVFLTTTEASENILSNGGTFEAIDENNIDAVIFSKEDLTLNGKGTLIITSPAGHGIVSKDSLTITSGNYDINCSAHGLCGKDDVCIADGNFKIVSGKDGIHAENSDDSSLGFLYIEKGSFDIASEGDGISAASTMKIENGIYNIITGGGSANSDNQQSDSWGGFMGGGRHQGNKSGKGYSQTVISTDSSTVDSNSMKGIKAVGNMTINNGEFSIDSADDSIHSNSSITVNGGSFEISSGDDAFHSDDILTVFNGEINITESYEGLEGVHIKIEGGNINITADDDGLNAAGGTDSSGVTGGRDGKFGGGMSSSSNGSITISGGILDITAYGDGIDANGTLEITDGFITVSGPNSGDTATLDYDKSGSISGGTFIGTGASMMAQSFSSAFQGVIAVNTGSQKASTTIIVTDSSGNMVLEHTPAMAYSVLIFSSPEIISGENYTINIGSLSGEITAQ